MENIDPKTAEGLGREWSSFDQNGLSDEDKTKIFDDYSQVSPWDKLSSNAVGIDVGCGSGRWAQVVAPRVGHLHLVDASQDALQGSKNNLSFSVNFTFYHASVRDLPFSDKSLDFAYSLGVLHHVPDMADAIRAVAKKLKQGSPFLVYLYYAFDDRPIWFRMVWGISDIMKRSICHLQYMLRPPLNQLIAAISYFPCARVAQLLDLAEMMPRSWPLAYYRDKSFYVMRTDALDRFGTLLEKRFSKQEIKLMLENSKFNNIHFLDKQPYWCAVGIRDQACAE